jgi:hypothetical protein
MMRIWRCIPIYEPGLDKIVGKQRVLFYGCGKKQLTRLRLFLLVNTPTKTYGKEKGWQPI